jgi:hypothetical protein
MQATLTTPRRWSVRNALIGALGTAITLLGTVALAYVIGHFVTIALHDHVRLHEPLQIGLSATAGLVAIASGGALWGIWMGQLAGYPVRRRMAWAGALGFAPITVLLAILLLLLELSGLEQFNLPLHRLFTLLFVPTVFLIASTGGLAIGLGLNNVRLGWRMAMSAGLTGALTFLAVNLILDALGWRVGGPNAEERMTMLTVMFSGDLAAALTAGAVVGWMVTHSKGGAN